MRLLGSVLRSGFWVSLPPLLQVIELDGRSDGPAVQQYLGEITGATSVPRVFIDGEHATLCMLRCACYAAAWVLLAWAAGGEERA